MKAIKQIYKIIDQIVICSENSLFYKSEFFNIAHIFRELKDRVKDFPTENYEDELDKILIELNMLLKVLEPLQNENWLQENLKVPISQPITQLKEIVSTIIELVQKIGIILDNKYDISQDILSHDLQSIYGMLLISSRSDNQKYKSKRDEIEEYLKNIQKPLITLNSISLNQSNSIESIDFTDVKMYKLDKDSYTHDSYPVTFNNIYEIYEGQMNLTKEPVNIMVFEDITLEKFRTLVNVLITARHDNLDSFVGAVESPLPYIIVTRRRGRKLNEMINDIPVGYKTQIAYQIAKGMAYLHAFRIIHRDLCSLNVTVDDEFNARITNFANSRFIPEDIFNMSIQPKTLNTFIAPELNTRESYNESVDVFSFSAILYELLTGKPPFEGLSENEIQSQIQKGIRPKIKVDDASKDLVDLITSCWSEDPKKRPSFVVILSTMLKKTITFPDEEENDLILQFYDSKKIENGDFKKCFELFEQINEAISYSYAFHQEVYRIHTLIYCYHYLLHESDFYNQTSFDSKIENDFYNLKNSLENLLKTIRQTEKEKWFSISLDTEVLEIPRDLLNFMESIYVSMDCLGFDAPKYDIIKSDLVLDLRLCHRHFQRFECKEASMRINEIK